MFPDTLINIGDKGYVTLYGVFIAIGVVCCMLILRFLGKKIGVTKEFLDFTETTGYIAVLAGIFGASLFQDFYNFLQSGEWHFFSGLTFIGGLIVGAATFLVIYVIRRKKLNGRLVDVLPIVPICITVAHGFGRIGCNFAGCCHGMDIDVAISKGMWPSWLAWMGVDMSPSHGAAYSNVIPTQLMEACFLFVLAGIICLLVLKFKKYNTFPIYTMAYGIWRFLIEFVRDDSRGKFIGNITPSQFWSLVMVVISIPLLFVIKRLTRANTSLNWVEKGPKSIEV